MFHDWSSILETTKEIYEGKTNVKAVANEERQEHAKTNGMNGTTK